jgi:vancomycin permeability regulator SanA
MSIIKRLGPRAAQSIRRGFTSNMGLIARGVAIFIGGFSLLNLLGEWRYPGFDANIWWINLRPMNTFLARTFLMSSSIILLTYALKPSMGQRRRRITSVLVLILLVVCIGNGLNYYILLSKGSIAGGFVLPFSLLVSGGMIVIWAGLRCNIARQVRGKSVFVIIVTLMLCGLGFALGQMYCFGRTDYRRHADVIVVLGARVYADGRCSDALADRVRTGCELYLDGFADKLIFSGGPGDGAIHETEAMRQMAIGMGVPSEAIILDKEGVSTQATVTNSCQMFDRSEFNRVLVVSHFYHLPRIKMTYQRHQREVYTVPAKESYVLTKLPLFMLREAAGLWVYYLRPQAV